MSYREGETKIPRCLPRPAICELANELGSKIARVAPRTRVNLWPAGPLQVGKTVIPIGNEAMQINDVWGASLIFPLKEIWCSEHRSGISFHRWKPPSRQNGATRRCCLVSIKASHIKDMRSPFHTWLFFFFWMCTVCFDGKFVGRLVANGHGKPAPAVHQCFENPRHWMVASVPWEKPNTTRGTIPDRIVWFNNGIFFYKIHSSIRSPKTRIRLTWEWDRHQVQ